jgi:hypothetical protein
MNAVEYLPQNAELRSHYHFFEEHKNCAGITWMVSPGDYVTKGQVIGYFKFSTEEPVEIVAPIDARVARTFSPNVADLPDRPSVTIAMF